MAASLDLPVSISHIHGRYLVFSIAAVSYLRREHNICGVLTGSLPQIPQQNVFLGLPMELMPEEAKVLLEKNVGYIVDEVGRHEDLGKSIVSRDKEAYLQDLRRQGNEAGRIQTARKEKKREAALERLAQKNAKSSTSSDALASQPDNDDDSLFDTSDSPRGGGPPLPGSRSSIEVTALAVTPATSELLLPPTQKTSTHEVKVPSSYPLYAHLHSKGYFISPGLRFGCQYMCYPGDPLRFHSHFLTVGYDWDEEIDLMDLVGGGRLGTGVKKGFLIGGQETIEESEPQSDKPVRAWSIEWAGM